MGPYLLFIMQMRDSFIFAEPECNSIGQIKGASLAMAFPYMNFIYAANEECFRDSQKKIAIIFIRGKCWVN